MDNIITYQEGGNAVPLCLNSAKFFHQKIGLLTITLLIMAMDLYAQTNNYFGSSGAITGTVWSTIPGGPYTSSLNTTGGAILNFNNVATVTGGTIDIAGINATANVTSWTGLGTFGTGGTVASINVTGGVTLNMFSQGISTAGGTGFIKTGPGVLALSIGSTYNGGFTLNSGSIIVGGVNAMGGGAGNTLNLNGGVVASNANRDLTGKYPGGIFIGGNLQFGDVGVLANGSADLSFNNAISLGATNRQLTLGNAGVVSFGGIIGGTNGVSFTANANGTGIFDITNPSNSFTGPINILGGKVRFPADGCFGNAANTIVIDGGQLLSSTSFSIANTHLIRLGTSAGTGINVTSGSLTIDAIMADNTTNGSFTKYGAGTLILSNANSYTGITYNNTTGGTLQLNRPGGGTLPATNNIVQNGGTLRISTDQTLNDISLIGGNLTVDDGATLTINGVFDYFQPATITLNTTGKIVYGPAGALKYSGSVSKTITALEFPATSGPVNVVCNNSTGVILPFDRTITGSLNLTAGTFNIGAGALLDLNGASLIATGGFLAGDAINNATSDLTVRGNAGGTVIIPTNNINIGLRNVTVAGNRTVGLNGIDNLHLSGAFTIAGTSSFDNGGESQIVSGGGTPSITITGKFINRDQQGFTSTNGAIPGINPTLAAGCTIEYGLATGGPQVVTTRTDYQHIKFSGNGTKTIASAFNPAGTVYITGAAVVDAANHTFGNINTNLNMDGGRLRMNGTNNPQPHMGGIYSLTGGVIEFGCNNISGQTIRPEAYQNIEVTGQYVGNSSGNITLKNNGSFTVKSGGVFEINDDGITGPFGTGETVTVETGATFKTGDKDGFSGGNGATATSVNQSIENIILAPGSTVEYSRNDVQNISNLLPYQNLVISGTAGVKTAPAGTITINGNLLKAGGSSFAHNNGHVVFSNATAIQNFTNTGTTLFNFYDLTNDNSFGTGLTVNNNLGIANVLTLSANSKLDLAIGDITLLSTATNTARVATVPATASVTYATGRFNVQRYFPGDRSWRLITSPLSSLGTTGTIFSNWQNNGIYSAGIGTLVTGKTPGPGNGLDDSFYDNYSMKKFENNAYLNVDNTLVSISKGLSLNADNIGYFMFVRGDRNPVNTIFPNTNNTTLNSRGKLQIGTQVLPGLPRTGAGRYFALVGNPFASPVNFKDLARINLINRFVVWDPKINQVGAFVVIDDVNNTGTYTQTPLSVGGQDLNIQSSQAFFVETDATVGPASISFDESNKTTVNNSGMFRPLQPSTQKAAFRSSLNLVNADGTMHLADGNYAVFNEAFHDAVDNQDAFKFVNIHEDFALIRNKTLISMERRPLIAATDTLFFNLTHTSQRNYRFMFEPENLDPLLMAFLDDNHMGLKTAISVSSPSIFDFAITAASGSAAPDRFRIVFKQATSLAVTYTNVRARQQGSGIAVEWTVENETDIVKYEVERSEDGNGFSKQHTVPASGANQIQVVYKWQDPYVQTGDHFYRIRSIDVHGKQHYSNIVKVQIDNNLPGISIFPNPFEGDHINMQFNRMKAGVYQLSLVNQLGQLVHEQSLLHTGGDIAQRSILIKNVLMSGIYQLRLIDQENNFFHFKLLVK